MNGEKIVFNTSRGEVIETSALKNAINNKIISAAVLDVWENEPNIDQELMNIVDIATPHIAGYSADGKANGTAICVRGLSSFFNLDINDDWYPSSVPLPGNPKGLTFECKGKSNQEVLSEIIFQHMMSPKMMTPFASQLTLLRNKETIILYVGISILSDQIAKRKSKIKYNAD